MEKLIKKLSIVLILIMAFVPTLTSCGGEDDEPAPTSGVVGTWRLNFSTGYVLQTFGADGQFTFVEIFNSGDNNSGYGTYSLNGNKLTMTYDEDDKETYTIISLTAKKMILTDSDGDIEEWTRQE